MAFTKKDGTSLKLETVSIVDPNGKAIAGKEGEAIVLRIMALYGIKDAHKLTQFLKSPAGAAVIKTFVAELMLQRQHKQQQDLATQDATIRRQRALGFLLLALLYQDKANARHRYEEIIAQIKGHKREKTMAEINQEIDEFRGEVDHYHEQMIHALEEQLQRQNELADDLEVAQDKLEQDTEYFEVKYEAMDKAVSEALDDVKDTPDASIEAQIKALDDIIEQLMDEAFVIADKDGDPMPNIAKANALGAKRALLVSLLADDHYTMDGDLIPKSEVRQRYDDVTFTLKPDLALVKHDGALMVLAKDQKPDDLTPEQRQHAVEQFLRKAPEFTEVSKLCASNKAGEKRNLTTRQNNLNEQGSQARNAMMALTSQIDAIERARAQIHDTHQTQQSKPAHSSPPPIPKPNPGQVTSSYRHMLRLMTDERPDPAQLMAIAKGIGKSTNPDKGVRSLLVKRLEEAKLITTGDSLHKQLSGKGPIQTITLQELQQRVEQQPGSNNQIQSMTPMSTRPQPR